MGQHEKVCSLRLARSVLPNSASNVNMVRAENVPGTIASSCLHLTTKTKLNMFTVIWASKKATWLWACYGHSAAAVFKYEKFCTFDFQIFYVVKSEIIGDYYTTKVFSSHFMCSSWSSGNYRARNTRTTDCSCSSVFDAFWKNVLLMYSHSREKLYNSASKMFVSF